MHPEVDSPKFWDDMYQNGSAGWDIKTPTPVFLDIIESQRFIRPSKILVVGCGKGHDAIAAAQAGYEVTAVDFSEEAVETARLNAEKAGVKIEFKREDIFNTKTDLKEKFDIVYDYTTLCAINPSRRKEYADRLCSFIKSGGMLVIILFPVGERPGGPPFGINVKEFYRMISGCMKLQFASKQINSIKPRKGREVLHIYAKQN